MRAYVFVRYNSGDGAGHVAWGFELPDGRVYVGSVENHSGHLFTQARDMGFWCEPHHDFIEQMIHRKYDELRCFDAPAANFKDAFRVTKWIANSAYRAFTRNCEDDVYDVLRAYGVQGLEAPFFNWFPRWWFSRLRGPKINLREATHLQPERPFAPQVDPALSHGALHTLPPLQPVWRRPFHHAANVLTLAKLTHVH